MSFTIALLLVCAAAVVVLALAVQHLLARLHLLEQAVEGGLGPPSRRLTREEFDLAFERALTRKRLAAQVDCGVVLVVGAGAASREVAEVGAELSPHRPLTLVRHDGGAGATVLGFDAEALGITTTPFVMVIDEGRVRVARPLASADELIEVLRSDAAAL